MLVKETHKKKINKKPRQEVEEMIKKLRKENEKLVKGRFEFLDAQGGWISFSYRYFPGEPIQTFTFYHGETCEIPLGIVKHINNTVKKVRQYERAVKDESGMERVPRQIDTISRIRFTPVDFL